MFKAFIKGLIGLQLFSSLHLSALPAPANLLESRYPGISAQIERIAEFEPELGKPEILQGLVEYLSANNPEIRKGMNLILAKDILAPLTSMVSNLKIDGNESEWKNLQNGAPKPDGGGPAQILEQKAILDASNNLLIMMKPKLQIGRIPPEYKVVWFLRPNGDESSPLQFIFVNGKITVKDEKNGSALPYDLPGLEIAAKNVYELRVPLKPWLESRGDIASLELWTGYFNRPSGSFARNEFQSISQQVSFIQINYVLLLLLDMVRNNAVIQNDSIALAIAYANGQLYGMGDTDTRLQIKQDLIKHLEFYKKVNAWQDARRLPYRLNSLPVIPKIFWSARYSANNFATAVSAMARYKRIRLSKDIYGEFIDKVEVLERIHDQILPQIEAQQDIHLMSAQIENLGGALCEGRYVIWKYDDLYKRGQMTKEEYDRAIAQTKNDYEIEYFGVKRNWEEFAWINYQFPQKCFRGQKILGDCVTQTEVMNAIYKAAGISVMRTRRINNEATFAYPANHVFPVFYDPSKNWWQFRQIPEKAGKDYNPQRSLTLHIDMAVKHSLSFSLSVWSDPQTFFAATSSSQKQIDFMQKGLDGRRLEKFFMQRSPAFTLY